MNLSKGRLLFNTIKYLRPVQIVNQAAVRLRKKEKFHKYEIKGVRYTEYNLWIDGLDNDPAFIARFKPEMILDDQLTLLHETRTFDRWNYQDAHHLWNFNVHYLEYLVPLMAMWKRTGDENYRFKADRILLDWHEKGCEEPDSNQAYTISLRIVNLLIIAIDVSDKQRLYDAIYAQYQFLLKHQEKHLLGNHYFENLKAIVICSLVFNEDDVYEKYIKILFKELREELTHDYLHFELSLMYHKIILEDLIRVAVILRQAQKEEFAEIVKYIGHMCTALHCLESGISRTPLFNDAGDNVAKPSGSLLFTCKSLFNVFPQNTESSGGYQRINDGKITVIMDCGELSPSYMPGHAHCDCLSFELFYDSRPVFVNSGTYQYQGEYRSYFRSTSAHNTVLINGHEQSELWAEHRAARRISHVKSTRHEQTITGEYRNYLGERHRRKLKLANGTLLVADSVRGKAEAFLHLAPGLHYENNRISGNGLSMYIIHGNSNIRVVTSMYSDEFGRITENECLIFSWESKSEDHIFKIEITEN